MRLAVRRGTGRLRERSKKGEGKRKMGRKRRGKEVKDGSDGATRCPTHVTHMVKQSAEPMNAMMLSNAGKTIEMAKNIKIVTMRTAIFAMPLK